MGNTLEYILKLRDEFTNVLRGAAGAAGLAMDGTSTRSKTLTDATKDMFRTVSQSFELLTGNYGQLGSILGQIPGPIGVIAGQIGTLVGSSVTEVLNLADSFDKLSRRTGFSVEFLSGFTEAADDVRISAGTVEGGITKFARALGGLKEPLEGAMENGKGLTGSLKEMGVAAFDTDGNMRPMEEILLDVADAFAAMPAGPEKAAKATQMFGRSGAELIPILDKGRAAIQGMMQGAKDAGLVIDRDTVIAMDRLKRSQDALNDSWTGITRNLGSAIIPELANFTHAIQVTQEEQAKVMRDQGWMAGNLNAFSLSWKFLTGELKDTTLAVQAEAKAEKDVKESAEDARAAADALRAKQDELRDSINNVTGAFGGQTEAMTDMEFAQMAIDLATGKTNVKVWEQKQAAEALTKAYKDGEIGFDDVVLTMTELAKENISVEEAMKRAGKAGDKYAAEMRGVEAAAQRATASNAIYKGGLDQIPAVKNTTVTATLTEATDAIDRHKSNLGTIPATKSTMLEAAKHPQADTTIDAHKNKLGEVPSQRTTTLDASIGSQMTTTVDWAKNKVGELPSQRTTSLNAGIDSGMPGTVDWAKSKINELPSQKTTTATVNTSGIDDQWWTDNTVEGAIRRINELQDMGLNLNVATTITEIGSWITPPPPVIKQDGKSIKGGGMQSASSGGGIGLNMPMSINVKQLANARQLAAQFRAMARRASARQGLG